MNTLYLFNWSHMPGSNDTNYRTHVLDTYSSSFHVSFWYKIMTMYNPCHIPLKYTCPIKKRRIFIKEQILPYEYKHKIKYNVDSLKTRYS